ncbi:MAG: 16S rRNA (cytidine(1402)-2'-O)-methyltransferase [Clostridia bacterium]|nr:16S rRNA (cytidine(1402)-2'-O)-methyltransferase [Clostridia bacterium]MBN2883760.1 16S rRNA (cytidine(1402)-2'-O)-methyltransferase [Clostridia bacterium]
MLYLVATPIGNLGDISKRALEVLGSCDVIACEDTRHTIKLLNAYEIKKPLVAFHMHNEKEAGEKLLEKALEGNTICLVSDAGCPGISDPGEYLVKLFHENNIGVSVIPGPNAALSALMVSGLPTEKFVFEGFLPSQEKIRREHLVNLCDEERTMLFYEAPHRIGKTLCNMRDILGKNREAAVIKEITKLHETIIRGPLGFLFDKFSDDKQKGEFVIVVKGGVSEFVKTSVSVSERYSELIENGMDRKEAMRTVAKEFNISRREVYSKVNDI